VKTFWEFCEERDSIREKKSSGVAAPWTDDLILRNNHFTNIDRNFDKGTVYIQNKLKDVTPSFNKMFWVFVYRFSGSNQKLFEHLDLSDPLSIQRVPEDVPKFYSGAYSRPCFPKGKGIGIRFLTKDLLNMFPVLYNDITNRCDDKILYVAEDLADLIAEQGPWRRMHFHCSEIAKDLALFFPQYVNPYSETALGKGAKVGLRSMGLKAKPKVMWELVYSAENNHKLGLNYNCMEHALCEYGKYVDIYNAGKDRRNRRRNDV
jgi:hypothetical protein